MKAIATLVLSVALCGFVSAAPITTMDSGSAIDVVGEETGGNLGNGRDTINDSPSTGGGSSGATPEPATVALLGIGLGLAALRRRM